MEGKLSLPVNWEELSLLEKTMWFIDNFGTDEDDEEGFLIYNTEAMAEDVIKEYNKVIVSDRENRKNGIILD